MRRALIALCVLAAVLECAAGDQWRNMLMARHRSEAIDWLIENLGLDVTGFGTMYMERQNSTGTGTYTNGPASGTANNNFAGGVLAPNGKVIFVPLNSNYVGIYDPVVGTINTSNTRILHPMINKF